MQPVEEKNWYLLQAKPKQHDKALRNLIILQYECFSPNITINKLTNGVQRSSIEPLFPGYIFIKLKTDCNWVGIALTRGVSKFVRFGAYPTKINNGIINAIKLSLPGYEAIIHDHNTLKKGDLVRIKESAFADFEGVFECNIGSYRSAILIRCLEKTHRLVVNTDLLEKAF